MGINTLTEQEGFNKRVSRQWEVRKDIWTEFIKRGHMETSSGYWHDVGSPTVNERSSTQKYIGSYSRKFTVDAADEGIKCNPFTTVAGKQYALDCWVYPDDGTTVTIRFKQGDGTFGTDYDVTGLTENAWNNVTNSWPDSAGGNFAEVHFTSNTSTSGTWYIDKATLTQTTDISTIEMSSNNYDNGTINLDVSDTNVLYFHSNGTFEGYFSNTAFQIQGTGANDKPFTDTMRPSSGFGSLVVPTGFQYFNYRTAHTGGSPRYIVMVKA